MGVFSEDIMMLVSTLSFGGKSLSTNFFHLAYFEFYGYECITFLENFKLTYFLTNHEAVLRK